MTRVEWEQTALYNEFYRCFGVRHELILRHGLLLAGSAFPNAPNGVKI
jgi:hypothetical protein